MSKPRHEQESASRTGAIEQKAAAPHEETWDPLASIRKTISPTQRMRLLKMEVPVLPPEDFMDTAELQRVHVPRTQRFLPLLLAFGAALLILSLMGLYLRFWSAPSNLEQSPTAARTTTQPAELPTTVDPTPSLASPSRPANSTPSSSPQPEEERPPQTRAASLSPAKAPLTKSSADATQSRGTQSNVTAVAEPNTSAPHVRPDPSTSTPQARTEPSTSTPPVPAPVPSGIKFWTQPR
jgi:hypothetical protein